MDTTKLIPALTLVTIVCVSCTSTPGHTPRNDVASIAVADLLTPFPPVDLGLFPDQPITLSPQVASEPDKPLVVRDLWAHLRRDMHLELHLGQKRVQQELAWLKRHPNYLHQLSGRLKTYLPYLYREVALRDMPVELALLPIVESALDVYAFSHGGAAGPWQFIRGTARQYELVLDEWYDGRRDIVASTDAALNLLTDLHARYDDWYLALAGYNAGQGNVNRALRRNPNADFFQLRLPRETRAYVPRLLALAAVIKDPDAYDLTLPEVTNELTFAQIDTHGQFQINTLVETLGMSEESFRQWNPGFNRWATSPRGPHRIILPLTMDIQSAQAAVDAVPPSRRVDWEEITVRSGDTLSQIARRFNTDIKSLQIANGMSGSRLHAGHKLLIPTSGSPRPISGSGNNSVHTVAAGESLWAISRQYQVNLRKLMRLNEIGPKDPLAVGARLVIPDGRGKNAVVRKVRYKVRRGDSLARIASKFNVTVAQIANWNNLDVRRYLQPGQGLLLYVDVLSS